MQIISQRVSTTNVRFVRKNGSDTPTKPKREGSCFCCSLSEGQAKKGSARSTNRSYDVQLCLSVQEGYANTISQAAKRVGMRGNSWRGTRYFARLIHGTAELKITLGPSTLAIMCDLIIISEYYIYLILASSFGIINSCVRTD